MLEYSANPLLFRSNNLNRVKRQLQNNSFDFAAAAAAAAAATGTFINAVLFSHSTALPHYLMLFQDIN